MLEDDYDDFNELFESPIWDFNYECYCERCGGNLKARTEKYGDFYRDEVYCPRCGD